METSRKSKGSLTPIDVAQDLVESLASEVEFEQALETEYEVADRLAVIWGRTAFSSRFSAAKGQVVQVHVAHPISLSRSCGTQGSTTLDGRLVDLGPDWLVVEPAQNGRFVPQVIIPMTSVLGVSGLPKVAGGASRQSKIWEHQRLTQLLRALVGSSQRVRIHSDFGCFCVRVVLVAADHLDVELLDASPRDSHASVSLRFSAISFIEADLR